MTTLNFNSMTSEMVKVYFESLKLAKSETLKEYRRVYAEKAECVEIKQMDKILKNLSQEIDHIESIVTAYRHYRWVSREGNSYEGTPEKSWKRFISRIESWNKSRPDVMIAIPKG